MAGAAQSWDDRIFWMRNKVVGYILSSIRKNCKMFSFLRQNLGAEVHP